MAGKARQERDEIEGYLVECHQSLLRLCAANPVQKRQVTKQVGELDKIWAKLMRSHSLFCKSTNIGISSTESSDYLRDRGRLKEDSLQAS